MSQIVDKHGPFYFTADDRVLVKKLDMSSINWDAVAESTFKHNALLQRMAKPKPRPGKPKPGC